ncbi:MAG: hypothetical protein B6245_14960 [Desulfobacteraceae bacterium 4572_88]|nr:MAG: hypothetical protein B6245_14960 [Desulfobacteraceae bacterium 4572_88]
MSKIFISYSRKDEKWRERIVSHLEAISDPDMKVWYDTRISPGEEWYPEIEHAMNTADAVILVVSRNFLTSEFIREEEIPRILKRKEKDELIVIPVIAESCAWKKVPWLSKMAFRPKTGEPLSSGENEYQIDAELTTIAEELYDLLPKLEIQRPYEKNRSLCFVKIGKSISLESVADRFTKEHSLSDERDQLDIGQYLHEQISKALGQNTPDENEADIRIISPDKHVATLPWHLVAKDKVFRTRWAVSLTTQSHLTDYTLPSAPKVLIIAPQPVGMERTDAESHLEILENSLPEKNHRFSQDMGIEVAYTWEECIRKLETSIRRSFIFTAIAKTTRTIPGSALPRVRNIGSTLSHPLNLLIPWKKWRPRPHWSM